ncbi:transmembrane protein, putative (macronuclear) [Tetrahymena thermophila SB210]|uniref:Transmembrane protein, putative n=1 Tax=Tetrahymena thermophila (strain SB210) TaxID=312017 RepID=I7M8M6_TETTS|nr:transmembrane protein, putative [Tetrahymena thermophila SB210]EAR98464.2 transmembrane protein, putative [Tetrahymena thermophila SB210]|eukprot:XP_001018709.2 transmembrane protein, putative [Tetrahymena thermophila SB210]
MIIITRLVIVIQTVTKTVVHFKIKTKKMKSKLEKEKIQKEKEEILLLLPLHHPNHLKDQNQKLKQEEKDKENYKEKNRYNNCNKKISLSKLVKKIISLLFLKCQLFFEAKKKLGEKEQEIQNLSTQIGKQQQNLNELNQQNENLKAKTDQLDTVIQEKSNLENHFATQMIKVEQAKKAIKRKQSLFNDKAEEFQKALNQKSFRVKVTNKMKSIFTFISQTVENHYYLSSQVYQISNSYGSKSEVSFSSNAYYVNIYIFSLALFVPFFVYFFLHTQIDSFEDIFLHSYSDELGLYLIITMTIFFVFQVLFSILRFTDVKQKEIREIAKSGKEINNFRIAFAEWNWKIKDYQITQKSQFALKKYAESYFKYETTNQYQDLSSHQQIKDILILFVFIAIIVGSLFATAYIHYEGYLLKIANIMLVSEIAHGATIACIGRFSCEIMNIIMKQKAGFNSNEINSKKYSIKFICQSIPTALSILITYNTFLNNNQITLDFDLFSTKIPYNSSKFDCPEQQVSHFLLGLVVGHFIVNIFWQYLPSILTYFSSGKQGDSPFYKRVEYSMMQAQIPLVVINMTLLALLPFTGFAIIFSVLLFYFNFYNEWLIIHKFKLPQYKGAPKSQLKLHFTYFQNLTLMFIFCCYSLYYLNIFQAVQQGNSIKSCSPYSSFNQSLYGYIIDKITTVTIFKDIYEFISWYPLLLVFLFAFYISHANSQGLYKFWKQEIKNKNSEISGVKTYYEQRIERLENKIKETQQVLYNIQNPQSYQETTDDFGRIPESRRQSDESIMKNPTQFTLNFDTEFKIKGSSGSIKPLLYTQINNKSKANYNLNDIEEEDESQMKQTSIAVFK